MTAEKITMGSTSQVACSHRVQDVLDTLVLPPAMTEIPLLSATRLAFNGVEMKVALTCIMSVLSGMGSDKKFGP